MKEIGGYIAAIAVASLIFIIGLNRGYSIALKESINDGIIESHGKVYKVVPAEVK